MPAIYRQYPALRGRLTPALPLLLAARSRSWDEAGGEQPRQLWLVRKTAAGPAVVTLAIRPNGAEFLVKGAVLRQGSTVADFRQSISDRAAPEELDEQELARRAHAMLASAPDRTLTREESEWLKLLPPLPAGETADPASYGLAHEAQVPSSAAEMAADMAQQLGRTFDATEANRWITREAYLRFAQDMVDGFPSPTGSVQPLSPRDLLIVHMLVQLRSQLLLIDLNSLRRVTVEGRLGDVSAHDAWQVVQHSPPVRTEQGKPMEPNVFARMDALLALVEWMRREGLLVGPPRLSAEWRGWLYRMEVEEKAGAPQHGTPAMDVLAVDLGFRVITALPSRVRPGVELPVYDFDVEAGRYLESHNWRTEQALAALPGEVPCAEAKRRLLRRFVDAVSEAGLTGPDLMTALKRRATDPQAALDDPEPYLQWWRLGYLTRGMCALVGCLPDPPPAAPEGWEPAVDPGDETAPEPPAAAPDAATGQ